MRGNPVLPDKPTVHENVTKSEFQDLNVNLKFKARDFESFSLLNLLSAICIHEFSRNQPKNQSQTSWALEFLFKTKFSVHKNFIIWPNFHALWKTWIFNWPKLTTLEYKNYKIKTPMSQLFQMSHRIWLKPILVFRNHSLVGLGFRRWNWKFREKHWI